MDAVKEAQLEQKIEDLTGRFDRFEIRFDQAEERNQQEHRELRAEIGAVRTDLTAELASVRTDLTAEIRSVRTELTEEVNSVRTDLTADIKAVRTDLTGEIQALRAETIAGFRDLHRLLFLGMSSFIATVVASLVAVVVADVL